MRFFLVVPTLALSMVSLPVSAGSLDKQPADQQTINALQAKIGQARPSEHCYLYAQLVHQLAELSMHQYAAGDVDKATALLKQVNFFSAKLHLAFSQNDHRLKNAEILLRHTSFRLNELLHSSSFEDRELIANALAQVTQVQQEAMLRVFDK